MPREIGWSQEANLLYNIKNQLSTLGGILASSGGGGGGTITGGGVNGQVTFWNGATSITGSNNLFWDNATSRLGIGTNVPITPLHLAGFSHIGTATTMLFQPGSSNPYISSAGANSFQIRCSSGFDVTNVGGTAIYANFNSANATIASRAHITIGTVNGLQLNTGNTHGGNLIYILGSSGNGYVGIDGTGAWSWEDGALTLNANTTGKSVILGTQGVQKLRVYPTGNVVIQNGGTFADNLTDRLQVNGSARFTGLTNVGALTLRRSDNIRYLAWDDSPGILEFNPDNNSIPSIRMRSQLNTFLFVFRSNTNNIGIGVDTPNASSILDVSSTSRGFLPPRMTTTQKNAISSPAAGLVVYDTTINDLEVYNGSTWVNDGATVITTRQTASYTLALTDRGKLVEMNVGAANTITVPPNSAIALPVGSKIDLAQYGTGQTSVVAGVGVTIRSAGGALKLSAQYSGATLVKIATDEWYLFGDITV